jgi:toxin YoeB
MASGRITVVQKQFREDLKDWVKVDRKVALKILELMEDVARDPFAGKGKPEPLKHLPGNVWSRRITQEHRLVYRIYDKTVDFLQCRYHY